jgi:hypothetical protein
MKNTMLIQEELLGNIYEIILPSYTFKCRATNCKLITILQPNPEHPNIRYSFMSLSCLQYYGCFGKNCEKHLLALSCLSVPPSICLFTGNNSIPTGWIFVTVHIGELSIDKIQFGKKKKKKRDKNKGYLNQNREINQFVHMELENCWSDLQAILCLRR